MQLEVLATAVRGHAAAFRSKMKLQPVGGQGDKVFPVTYEGGVYAREARRKDFSNDGSSPIVDCVLLDSVPSQANRAEETLLDAVRRSEIDLPLIEVDFTQANKSLRIPLRNLTSLEVPHRLADAILRDSELADGTRFSKSNYAARWARANPWNATAIYELCPTALVFGLWGSPEKPGGLGAKFERAFVSEIIGVDTAFVPEPRRGYRIDPISASSSVLVSRRDDGGFDVASSAKAKGALAPSKINHSNIPYDTRNAGVRFEYAEQTTVVSLGALRKLRFPLDGKHDPAIDHAARTVLAALALCAGVLAAERGTSLRSRCHLWPTEERKWELLDRPGHDPQPISLDGKQAVQLLNDAIAAAESAGLSWNKETIRLQPTPELVELIRQSQEIQAKEGEEGGQ